MSVCVRVCPSVYTGHLWLSISTHISTLVLGLSTLTLPVDCSGDFGPRGLSLQYTQDICGCPPAHTGRPWLSVAVRQQKGRLWLSVCVRVCPSAHIGRPWLSIIHTRRLGESASTHRTSVAVCVCPSVFVSTHMTSVAVHQFTYQHAGPWTQHAGTSHDCSGRPCVSVSKHRTSVAVCVCPCVSVSTHMTSVAVHQYTYKHVGPWTQHADPSRGLFGMSVAVCGCPSTHTGRPWLSVCVRQQTQDVRGCPSVDISARHPWLSISTHRTSVCVCQHTQNVRVCLSAHTERPCVSVSTHMTLLAVRVCPSAHIGRPWLSISTHISTLVLGLSTLALPVDCLGDFGPRGLFVQYTQDVRGYPPAHTGRPWLSVTARVCPSAHTGRLWVSVSINRTSVCVLQHTHDVCGCLCVSVYVRQHTHDVRGCPSVHISARWSLESACWPFSWTVWVILAHVGCLFSAQRTSVGVRKHTQDDRGCSWLSVSTHRTSVAVRVCMCVSVSTHTGRLGLSISTHISTLVLGLSMLALPVDCSSDFGPRGQSVQYTQDVCGCMSAHTRRPCVSVSKHRMSMAVRVCPWVSTSTHRTSVSVCGCPLAHTGRPWLFVWARGCPSVHISACWSLDSACWPFPWTVWVILAHVGCLLSTHRTSVGNRQHTQDVRGCPWLSVSTHMKSVAVCVCPSAHTGRLWVSVSTHRTSVCVRQHTQDVCGCPCVSVCYTQDVCVCPSAHTDVRVCPSAHTGRPCVCPSAHTGRPWLSVSTQRTSVAVHQYTYQHGARVLMDWTVQVSLIDAVPSSNELMVQVPSVLKGKRTEGMNENSFGKATLPVTIPRRVFKSFAKDSTRRSVVIIIQGGRNGLSQRHVPLGAEAPTEAHGSFAPLAFQPRAMTNCANHRKSRHRRIKKQRRYERLAATSQLSRFVFVLKNRIRRSKGSIGHAFTMCRPSQTPHLTMSSARIDPPKRVLGLKEGVVTPPLIHGDVHGCPCVSVGVHQHTQDVRGCLWVSVSTHRTSLAVRVGPTHRTSVGVRQHTQDVRGCSSAHTGRPWLSVSIHMTSVAVRVCPCVSVSTHRTSVAVHQYTYQHAGPWTQHAGPSPELVGTSVAVRQHTQDVRGCLCVSVCVRQHTQDVRGCPSVPILTRWTSVGVRQDTLASVAVRVCLSSAHTGCPWLSISTHISTLVLGFSTLALPVDCLGDFGPRGLSVQYTQDVRGCPPAHIGRPWLFVAVRQHTQDVRGCPCVSVCVCVCPSAHTGRPCVYVSTHRTSVCVSQHTQDVCGCLFVSVCVRHHTQDVRVYTFQHAGFMWLSVSTHGTSVAVCVCPCVSVSTDKMSVAVHQYTYQHAGPWTQHAGPSCGLFGTHRTSLAVRVCLCVSVSTHMTSVAVHHTLVLGLSTLTLPMDCSGDFGPRGLSVQYTQDVRGCPPAHTGHLWLSVPVRKHTHDVRGCPCVSVRTHRTFDTLASVAVRVCLSSAHTGRMWLSISTHISTLVLGLSMLALPVDCLGDFGPRGLSVQYTQDVRGCPPAHIGRPWLSVAVRQHTQDVRGCPCVSVCVCVCPSAHTGRPWLYVNTHRTSVCVRQHTQDVRVCQSAHTGRLWLSVCVRVCPSPHTGRPCVYISARWSLDSARWPFLWTVRVILAHVGCLFSAHRRSVGVRHNTQDLCGCPSAHTGRPWLSVCVRVCPSAHTRCLWLSISTHISTLVLGLSTLALPVDCSGDFGPRGLSVQYTQDVCGCTSAHTGHLCMSVSTHRTSLAVRVCLCVSVSTHMTSVAVHQYTYQHVVHTGRPWVSASTHRTSVAIRAGPTHIITLVLGLSTLDLPMDCLDDFGPRGLSVQYTQDVCGCPSAHTRRLWLSVTTHRTSLAVRVCPCVSVSTHRTSVAAHQYTYQHAGPWTQHAAPSRGLFRTSVNTYRTSVCVRQHTQDVRGYPCVSVRTHRTSVAVHQYTYQHYTQDVRGCPPAHTGRLWLSVCVRVCLSVSVSTHRTSVAVHQYTSQHVGP
ncbi:hypothetical protein YC2023_108126 [Brassica napus]